jgi:hypothetical protein
MLKNICRKNALKMDTELVPVVVKENSIYSLTGDVAVQAANILSITFPGDGSIMEDFLMSNGYL